MVSKTDLASLKEYGESTGEGVLSIYLDVDQGNAANLNRGFELALRDELRSAASRLKDEAERMEFETSAARAMEFVSKYAPEARGLVVYSKSSRSIWARDLNVPTKTGVTWSTNTHIQPLLEALDEYQRYGVVLLDHQKARIYTILLGDIEHYSEVNSPDQVRAKAPGSNPPSSQAHVQRKLDEDFHSHLKRTVEVIENLIVAAPFERLVLAGSIELTSEMFRVLPKGLRSKVVGSVVLAINAADAAVLAAIEALEQRVERGFELTRVDKLLNASGSKQKATAGVDETLLAINEKRVYELMYSEGPSIPGNLCRDCGAVFASTASNCRYCNTALESVDDITELAITRSLASGARIEQFRGEAARRLSEAGGMGAFLRY